MLVDEVALLTVNACPQVNKELKKREQALQREVSELRIALRDVTDEKTLLSDRVLELQGEGSTRLSSFVSTCVVVSGSLVPLDRTAGDGAEGPAAVGDRAAQTARRVLRRGEQAHVGATAPGRASSPQPALRPTGRAAAVVRQRRRSPRLESRAGRERRQRRQRQAPRAAARVHRVRLVCGRHGDVGETRNSSAFQSTRK